MHPYNHILVLGIGNILLRDEGAGVRLVEQLMQCYTFSNNVFLLDGGTLGIRLLEPIEQADYLIVVDTLLSAKKPGTVLTAEYSSLKIQSPPLLSLHQQNVFELLQKAEILQILPQTVITGIVPKDINSCSTSLSVEVEAGFPELEKHVLKEIKKAGGSFWFS